MSTTTTQHILSDTVNSLLNPREFYPKLCSRVAVAVSLSDAQVQEISRGIRMLQEATERLVGEFRKLSIDFTPTATGRKNMVEIR